MITTIAHGAEATRSAGAMSEAQQQEVLRLLLGAAGESEEECRAVVAECLGSLALLNGQLVLPALRGQLASPSGAHSTVAAGLQMRRACSYAVSPLPCLLHPAPHPCPPVRARAAADEARTTVVSAVRHTFVDAPHGVDELLPGVLADFLARIGDEDR